jgi:peptidoglycan/xylan/chitin deacetylase (PgdA/CDA1 family)
VHPIAKRELLWFDRAALAFGCGGPEAVRRVLREVAPDLVSPDPFPAEVPGFLKLLRRAGHDRIPALLDDLERHASAIPSELASGFRLMTMEQVVELSRRGHEIASHTLSHPFLTDLVGARLRDELAESRRLLSGWLGRDIAGFCYPAGDLDAHAVAAVRESGYRYACTTAEGPNPSGADPYRLLRNDITSQRVTGSGLVHDPVAFRMEVSSLRHRLRRVFRRAP